MNDTFGYMGKWHIICIPNRWYIVVVGGVIRFYDAIVE